jgi:hypothetical protein
MACLVTRVAVSGAGALLVLSAASQALAWGATGHRLIGALGAAALPPEVPAFVHTPEAVRDIGELAREPDRSKGSGKIHDTTRDPAHFIDVDDAGKILGGPALDALPPTRAEYDVALQAVKSDSYHAGYLPYAIVDGWQQLVKDFAYWRVLKAAIPRERDAEHKAWLERDLVRREAQTINDLGVWAHYVGDASQPMHASVHFNGWGPYPNPNGYTQDRVHAYFEGAFVRAYVGPERIRADMTPLQICEEAINVCTARYIGATAATVEPYFALQKAGGFVDGDARGRAFTAQRIAAGASSVRDLVVIAWRASSQGSVGYPALTVDQVVRDGVDPFDALYGED